jgi:DNA-binding transcriptional regulator YiaG
MFTDVADKKRSPKAADCTHLTGPQLKALRTSKGLEQTEAAALLCVPVSTYRNWEQGRRAIPAPVLKLVRLTFGK